MDAKKQGIVSILVSDSDTPAAKATSLRRTLSADMSLTQGFMLSPLKKSPSSHEFPVSSSFEEGEEDNEASSQFDVWASIQRKNKEEVENRGLFDIWSSIVSQKAVEGASNSSPPYIHPLVKRSGSCLSDKSLEICTESLGSETGSDGFSSETGDVEEDKQEDQQLPHQKQEPVAPMVMPCFDGEKAAIIEKHNYDVGKKSSNPSFPPPISSLSAKDGASRQLKTSRDNGRLVIEAVSMPCLNNFLAQRQDGRLVLTFANTNGTEKVEELEEEFESFGVKESEKDIDEEGEECEDGCYEIEEAPKLSSGAIDVHRLAVVMNKPMWSAIRNPTWPKDINEIVKSGDEEGKVKPTAPPPPPPAIAQSLPPRPLVSRPILAITGASSVISLNTYECYWRRPNHCMSKGHAAAALDQQSQAMKGKIKGDELVPLLKGCKEHRSLLFWRPHCIATS
ncbi:U-box domain-containing protein 23 [Hibiscus syriacus]|uniref:U-box domain-containing protein 23 n=2 Tax=Hibiscus syriacus TaxID=106335 RepID=A0A6A3AP70_HIBSY|nr:U-box domain-containing protein 23 [Hibiscus syriacus]